ncbi:hypothetical protein CONLIGDRAFT_696198 [Coniochaeta ligniaria NRRL 30616]|uniref:Transmembrane protein n=1 Tax=Coniochaeta ligniaria NRRL 30616 TaxID=1408157 RepID=A0A1J7J0M2_9PEZI|nr:hypothetical protein CONLIGDRAFT_696198 [Coniochaeta ligniaria NRRL 30616]
MITTKEHSEPGQARIEPLKTHARVLTKLLAMIRTPKQYQPTTSSGDAEPLLPNNSSGDADPPPPKTRFLVRAISCVIVPPAFAAYYVWTYVQFLRPSSGPKAGTSTPDGRLIWWSWFILGAIGLNVSTYALAGVEAGMLMMHPGRAPTAAELQTHKDKSWSKLSGWANVIRRLLPSKHGNRSAPSWIWTVLFFLSFLSWAFVLSGLTMETEKSFKLGTVSGVEVSGANATTFDERDPVDLLETTYQGWKSGQPASIPLLGVLYSQPETPLADFNMTAGNSFPPDATTPLFLPAQAEIPFGGDAWGLTFTYSCRPIHKLEDFKILSKRLTSKSPGYLNGSEFDIFGSNFTIEEYSSISANLTHYFYDVQGLPGATISVIRDGTVNSRLGAELSVVAEVGLSSGVYNVMDEATRGYGRPYGGLDEEDVIEFALWQSFWVLNDTDPVQNPIPELSGEYYIKTVTQTSIENVSGPLVRLMDAIGVQCLSTSAVGSAATDGFTGTFRDFRRHDESTMASEWAVPRLSRFVPALFLPGVRVNMLLDTSNSTNVYEPSFGPLYDSFPFLPRGANYKRIVPEYDPGTFDPRWKMPLFNAGNLTLYSKTTPDGTPYTPFASAENLQLGLERAFQYAAASLMFSQFENRFWTNPNLTAGILWTSLVLPEDSVPPLLVLVALVLWALGCVVLGLAYSFRKRWDAFFSVGSLYWYCKMVGVDPMLMMKEMD